MLKRMLWPLPLVMTAAAFPGAGQERGRGRGAAVTLPDGPGREIVQEKCASCHALNLIVNSGYSRGVISTNVSALLRFRVRTSAMFEVTIVSRSN